MTMNSKLQEELLQQMSRLSEEVQRRVVAFVKRLTPVAGGVAGKNLLKLSGAIGQSHLQAMTKAIEEGCAGTR
jgi:hypothetical protein